MTNQAKDKILIVITDQNIENRQGGVYNFYMDLKPLLDDNHKYHSLNNDMMVVKNKLFTSFIHFIRMAHTLYVNDIKCLVLNTSLNINAILRDSVFALIAKIFKTRVLIFWHGWDFDHEKYLKFPYIILTKFLLKPNSAIVLYSEVGNSLKKLGYPNNIHLLTTLVRKSAFDYQISADDQNDYFNLIFFSRVESYKGVYELIEAFKILKAKYPKFKLTIVGDGSELVKISDMLKQEHLNDIELTGYVVGNEKFKLLSSASLFVLPSYTEGMPVAVLEAMAVGLPIVVTPVGGLNDFFKDEKMGSFITIKSVQSIVEEVEKLYLNSELRRDISAYNLNYAKQNFMDEVVYDKLKNIMNNT